MARSLDRLLTYAEGKALSEAQLVALQTEMDGGSAAEALAELREGLQRAKERIRAVAPVSFAEARGIGPQTSADDSGWAGRSAAPSTRNGMQRRP